MKTVKLIITYLTGIIYLVFSLNFFFNFLPMPPLEGDAGAFMGILAASGFLTVVKVIEAIVALMLLVNFQRPLAWLLILPITVNIAMYEVFIAHQPGPGIVLLVFNFLMVFMNREHYKSIYK